MNGFLSKLIVIEKLIDTLQKNLDQVLETSQNPQG